MSQGKKYLQTKLSFSKLDTSRPAETSQPKRRRFCEDSGEAEEGEMDRGRSVPSTSKKEQNTLASIGNSLVDQTSPEAEHSSSQQENYSDKQLDGSQDLFDSDDLDRHIDVSEKPLPSSDEETDELPPSEMSDDDKQRIEEGVKMWRGTPIEDLRTSLLGSTPKIKLTPGGSTKVMFQVPQGKDGFKNLKEHLKPFPESYQDKWNDNKYVFMPCSQQSKIPKPGSQGEIQLRWEVIEQSLTKQMSCSFDIQEAILSYNSHYKKKWDFRSLHEYFDQVADQDRLEFFLDVLPKMAELAIKLPLICTTPVPILQQHRNTKLVMSQEQVACLLANAFFCTFPRRNMKMRGQSLPDINFSSLFNGPSSPRKIEKLKCIMHYFKRVTEKMPKGVVSYERQVLSHEPEWYREKTRFTDLHVSTSGTIEDDGEGMLQADFANKYVGGGVLGRGCVQEEIRFMICPEMILSRLFTEMLTDNEVLIMKGCERFSNYTGYSDTFKWVDSHIDNTPRDNWGRLHTDVVAMDALVVRNYKDQFTSEKVLRELNKAYCACLSSEEGDNLSAFATGNWGCGAFGGDKHLKALLQLIAASKAGREVCFFTFGDERLCLELEYTHNVLCSMGYATGQVLGLIKGYLRDELRFGHKSNKSLFEYICTTLGKGWISPPRSPHYGTEDFWSQDYKANTP